jgi:RNA 2',3'-cyclic 3'-phosphodiesterase
MRLFIAIDLPAELKTALARLHRDLPGARWVAAAQIHLTLAFLGEVEEASAWRLSTELARIHLPPFTLTLTGTGCFPHRQRPRVLWVGLAPEARLTQLVAAVQSAILDCGLPVEERPFSAHITLARLRFPAAREVGAFLDQPLAAPLPLLPVHEFILFESRLLPHGAEHLPLTRFLLVTD